MELVIKSIETADSKSEGQVSGAPTNSTPTPLHESAQVDRKDDITSRAQPPPRWSKQDAIKASSARLAQQIAMMQASQSSESVVLFGGLASTTIGCSTMAAQILQHEQALGSSIGREISDQAVASPSYFTPPPSMAASSCEACFGRGLDACDKENTELYRGRFPPCESCSHNGHDFCVAHVQRNDCLRYPVCLQCQVQAEAFATGTASIGHHIANEVLQQLNSTMHILGCGDLTIHYICDWQFSFGERERVRHWVDKRP